VIHRALADAVVALHLAFILFALLGGLVVLRWRRLAWLHVPVVLWASLANATPWACPLTPLENRLRAAAGQAGYETSFVEHYVVPVVYPGAVPRGALIAAGGVVLLLNAGLYARLAARR
jgi:hypothetical protein